MMFATVADVAVAEEKDMYKPGAVAAGTVSVTATVADIDYETRRVTLKMEDGDTETLTVGEAAHNFNQVKKGDKVRFDYVEAVAVDVQKAAGPLGKSAEVQLDRAPKGAAPGGVITQTIRVTTSVEDIDYAKRTVKLMGPEGNVIKLKVSDAVKRLDDVKKGDHVVVVYKEALAVSVSKP